MTEQNPEVQEQGSEVSFDDSNFDAERAKGLIERLREENRALKGDRTPQDQKDAAAIASLKRQLAELKPKADQFSQLEEASKSEIQRATEAAEKARRDAEAATSEAIRYKAAATHGIGADHFDLLGSGTEEEITARALKIASLAQAQAAATQTVSPPATRPVEQLRPGATPAGSESEDDVVMAKLFGPPQ